MDFHFKNHLVVGFAGKRIHDRLSIVNDKLTSLFGAFDSKLQGFEIHFVTGLADGADQIAAQAFNQHYKEAILSKEKFLAGILPFNFEDYKKTIDNKQNYQVLYESCHQKLELDGKLTAGPDAQRLKNKAYQQQGTVLGRLCDLLVVAAPKTDAGKIGGSIQTLITTLGLKKAVIFINLDDGEFYLYESIEEWFAGSIARTPEQICDIICNMVFKPVKTDSEQEEKQGLIYQSRKGAWLWFERVFKGGKKKFCKN